MKKILITFSFLLMATAINAQHKQKTRTDSIYIKKYEQNTLGFVPFKKNGLLLDSIHPANGFVKYELNVISYKHYNKERYPKSVTTIPDTVVLSKPDKNKGFMMICAPNFCTWYMSAQKGKKIVTIQDLKGLSNFLGAIDNQNDAYLWLFFRKSMRLMNPNYKMVEDGFLLNGIEPDNSDMVLPDKTITTSTYLVGFDKRVVKIKTQSITIKNPHY